jgi:hypothetical protein
MIRQRTVAAALTAAAVSHRRAAVVCLLCTGFRREMVPMSIGHDPDTHDPVARAHLGFGRCLAKAGRCSSWLHRCLVVLGPAGRPAYGQVASNSKGTGGALL